jgi:hypothetical protein
MITGAHAIIYSSNAKADIAFFRDILKLSNVDAGNGWLIFRLPPSEIAVHPSEENDKHELYLLCENVEDFISQMAAAGVQCGPVQTQRWGKLTDLTLPGGGKIGVYEPLHAQP